MIKRVNVKRIKCRVINTDKIASNFIIIIITYIFHDLSRIYFNLSQGKKYNLNLSLNFKIRMKDHKVEITMRECARRRAVGRVNGSATRTERAVNGCATKTDEAARVGEVAFAVTRWRQSSVSYSVTSVAGGVGLPLVIIAQRAYSKYIPARSRLLTRR